ncbi:MAG TPA: hypothetical protein VK463_14540 [Desulfomonilaceae bacterium]|nr:hypothetical protein [Desulfomonilaceae bacterium]
MNEADRNFEKFYNTDLSEKTREEMKFVKTRRSIPAKKFMKEIQSGMTDQDLMTKYQLSARALHRVFRRLVDLRVLTEADLERRSHFFEGTAEIDVDALELVGETPARSPGTDELVWVTDGGGNKYLCAKENHEGPEQAESRDLAACLDVGSAPIILPED